MSAADGCGLSMRLLVFRGSGGGGANRCRTRGGHSCCGDRHDVADYLNARGWETDQTTMADLFAGYGQILSPPHSRGESYAVAQEVLSLEAKTFGVCLSTGSCAARQ